MKDDFSNQGFRTEKTFLTYYNAIYAKIYCTNLRSARNVRKHFVRNVLRNGRRTTLIAPLAAFPLTP